MDDRFRIAGVELGVDRRRSFAVVDAAGVASGTIRAGRALDGAAGPPPALVIARIPLRFDGELFGAVVDAEVRDQLFVDALSDDHDATDEDATGQDPTASDLDDAPTSDPGIQLHAGSRVDADGRLTHHAGDRLRFVGEATLPGGRPLQIEVSLAFGGRRAPRI
ncbi:hypothetical protein AX769_11665 [Frondihabitans sp. PAMC 28766]|uniref:hypothetical protein n=1 Tax=Frondihabitans sp. PAMC 28766 TaxID=1795630 RepID=UPI00078D037E|nr:hypothetical protein [Frondihabitans sp. PAMC 28766]AMM20677.1 hypothetical protein AX769_11665 [Frondihabitans sp. PAMC 28766]